MVDMGWRWKQQKMLDVEPVCARYYEMEEATARVRELCAREEAESAESARIHGTLNMAVVRTRAVLAAIGGEQT